MRFTGNFQIVPQCLVFFMQDCCNTMFPTLGLRLQLRVLALQALSSRLKPTVMEHQEIYKARSPHTQVWILALYLVNPSKLQYAALEEKPVLSNIQVLKIRLQASPACNSLKWKQTSYNAHSSIYLADNCEKHIFKKAYSMLS